MLMMMLLFASMIGTPERVSGETVPRFGVFEAPFEASERYENPYTQVAATASFVRPDGSETRAIPLFWDGGSAWRLRFSPDEVGHWRWSVSASDEGLDGKSGAFDCVPSERRGSVMPMPGQPEHFAYQDGTPMWWFGDTAWALYTNGEREQHDREAVEHYLDVRASQGFNVIHSMLISELDWGNEGGMPFEDLAGERINPAYWQEVDERVESVTRRGMIAGLVLAWTDKGESKQSWQHFPSDAARLRYARYAVGRYSAYPVYFVIAGEWDATGDDEGARRTYDAIGSEMARCDPHDRLRGIHSYPRHRHARLMPFGDSEWNSFADYQQCYRNIHGAIVACRGRGKPVVNAEYGYYRRQREDGTVTKPNSASAQIIRAATWDIAMAGGYFITGFGSTYLGGARTAGPFDVEAEKNDDWERQAQIVREFFASRPWWRLEPHDELVWGPVERESDPAGLRGGEIRPAGTTYWALGDIGRQYIVYVRGHEGTFRVSLGVADIRQPPRVRRFDPQTGEYAEIDARMAEGVVSLTTPDERDWVFEVDIER